MKTQVKAFVPFEIQDIHLVSSTIPEPHPDEPEFVLGNTFNEFSLASVINPNSHLVYESLQSGNTGKQPGTAAAKDWWLKKSYTNRWRMFDLYSTQPSFGQSPTTVVIRPGRRINAIVMVGIKATLLELVVRDGLNGPIIYTFDAYMLSRQGFGWYGFLYAPFVYDRTVSTFNIPPVSDPVIEITLQDPSGICEIGRFGTGMSVDIGEVEWNTVSDDGSYSDIKIDSSGWTTLEPVEGPSELQMTLEIDANKANAVMQFKRLSKNKLVMWSAMEGIESYRQMHVIVATPETFKISTKNHRKASIDLSLIGI